MNPQFDKWLEYTRFNVVSTRIRLARNVAGVPFPNAPSGGEAMRKAILPRAVKKVLENEFEFNFFNVGELSDLQIKALVERHLISPALARNADSGAAVISKDESVSVMINEEDHIREQCVGAGFDLSGTYRKIDAIDDVIISRLPIAYDERFGFLTACPTNLGTGMRASTMLFLPALRLADAIDDALYQHKYRNGMTIRGIYGEGSGALGDMYQLSNTVTLGLDEEEILTQVGLATVSMCEAEAAAREVLMREHGVELRDRIFRSFGVLKSAYSLSSEELLSLVSDAKLGVILGILPLQDTKPLDRLYVLFSASSLMLRIGECSPSVRDVTRAKLVREIVSEVI